MIKTGISFTLITLYFSYDNTDTLIFSFQLNYCKHNIFNMYIMLNDIKSIKSNRTNL